MVILFITLPSDVLAKNNQGKTSFRAKNAWDEYEEYRGFASYLIRAGFFDKAQCLICLRNSIESPSASELEELMDMIERRSKVFDQVVGEGVNMLKSFDAGLSEQELKEHVYRHLIAVENYLNATRLLLSKIERIGSVEISPVDRETWYKNLYFNKNCKSLIGFDLEKNSGATASQ